MMCLKPSAYYPNMSSLWFKSIDNTPLVLWRVIFGFLIAAEAFGAIITGWVHDVLIAPSFTFNFIGFEFLQPLPGWGMYAYFFAMGSFGIWSYWATDTAGPCSALPYCGLVFTLCKKPPTTTIIIC